MLKGITYMVRPFMEPVNTRRRGFRISLGSIQLLVGPASARRLLQMKVRSSTRATSPGSDRARKLLGRLAGFRRRRVPEATICPSRVSFSVADPSHQWIAEGVVRVAISSTQA